MKNINPATGKPWKILWFGDGVGLSGFGRIGNETCKRLKQRGYDVQMAVINYSGWPHDFSIANWIWPLAGQDIWGGLVGIVNQIQPQPDLLISCQDFPYHQTIWQACRIDFSRVKWVWITPIDGEPLHPDWLKLCDFADGEMVISRFGVEAMRREGKRVELCHPGVDTREFYPADEGERKTLREKAGYGPDDYVCGVACMNQGRKAISCMIEAFHEFARDKSNAKLYLDMDKASPAGWDIPNLLKQMRWTEDEQKRVKYREDMFKADMTLFAPLRARYALMDMHMVISHREGFGLPLLETMACHIPTMALDWCSGTEICGGGRGMLIKRLPYMEHGTWGGAKDAFPDMDDFVLKLNLLYQDPTRAAAIAEEGYRWAIQQTWDVTADQVEAVVQSALSRNRKDKPSHEPNASAIPVILSDTYGRNGQRPDFPATPEAADALGHHSELQQSPGANQVPAIAGGDGADGGAGGTITDSGTG